MATEDSFSPVTFHLELVMSRAVAVTRSVPVPRALVSLLVLALLTLLALAVLPSTSHAQLGGLAKKAKQAVAGKSEKPAVDQPAKASSVTITTASVASFISGLKAEQHVADSGRAAAKEARAKYDANAQAGVQNWMSQTQKYDECTDEHTDNDPRAKERQKVQTAAGMARYKGETKKADSLDAVREKLDAKIIADAEKACEKLKTTPEDLQKQMMNQPPQPDEYGMAQEAVDSSIKIGARTAGLTSYQYAQMKETVVAYLQNPKKSGVTGDEAAAIDARKPELAVLLKAVGAM